jgi:hypothetical protein
MALHGVDVSMYQNNWVPDSVDRFVFIKSTEGRTWSSTAYATQLGLARRAQLVVGHYHFLWPGNAKEQAAYFVAKSDIKPGELLVCDWEDTKGGHPSVADAANFIAEVKRLKPDNRVGLYCNKSAWLDTAVKKGDFLWIASWSSSAGVSDYDFWQYTDKPLDQNWAHPRFNTKEELLSWATPNKLPAGVFWSDTWQSQYLAFGGEAKWITPIDKTVLLACAQEAGWGSVRIVQGGRRPHTDYSGWTHNGLGVGDIAIDGRTRAKVWQFCATLRRSGIRPFPRGYGGDPWENEKHIHFGSRESYAHAHDDLKDQVKAQEAGRNGLAKDGPYNGPSYADLGRWANSPYNPANVQLRRASYVVDPAKVSTVLLGKDVDDNTVRRREPGYELQAVKLIKRWGRWNAVTSTPTYYALDYLKEVV